VNDRVRAHTDKAVEFLQQGRLPHAAVEFEHAIRLAPHDVTLRQRLGDTYLRLGLRTHAVREFQHVAGRYASEGQLLKAIAICKVILEIDPGYQQTLRTLADLYAAQRENLPRMMPESWVSDLPAASLDIETLALVREALAKNVPQPEGSIADEDDEATVVRPKERPLDVTRLPRSPLFSALDKYAFEAVVQSLDLRWMKKGESIVKEGEPGDSMFVVVQGMVNVAHGDRVVATMTDGAFFGEMALMTDSPRLASVSAAKDGLLFEIHRERLAEIFQKHPGVYDVVDAFYKDRLLANVLRASPVFRPLDDAEKRAVSERFSRRSVPPRTLLLEQGKPGSGVGLLLRGQCEAFHTGGKGEEIPLPALREGDLFGEISSLFDGPCTASVRTTSACEVLELPREDFRKLVLPNAGVRAIVQEMAGKRLQRTADLLQRENAILPDYIV
jgi:cAMP-dependent protein kinase regulator